MDWSSVFDDQGEEEGDWEREDISSTRTGILLSLTNSNGNKYSPVICYAFTVNYILGVGCLGIPFAFLQSGIVLGSLLVVLLSYVSYITVIWVASASQQEILFRKYQTNKNPFIIANQAQQQTQKKFNYNLLEYFVINNREEKSPIINDDNASSLSSSMGEGTLYSSIMTRLNNTSNKHNSHTSLMEVTNSSNRGVSSTEQQPAQSLKVLKNSFPAMERGSVSTSNALSFSFVDKKGKGSSILISDHSHASHAEDVEVTDLAREVLGTEGRLTYQSALMMLTYVGLLAYSQVFNSTFVTQVCPLCSGGYAFLPSLLFGAVVIPLSCFDLAEQITLQVVMSLLRFLSLGILLFGTLAAIFLDSSGQRNQPSDLDTSAPFSATTSNGTFSTPLVQWSGFGVMFTTAIFSQLFQHSVPGLVRPLAAEDRKYIPQIFKYALLTTAVIYIAIGTACVVFFGNSLEHSVNLNFVDFDWGYDRSHHGAQRNEWVRMSISLLSMVVVLFPALDTLSVFPLIANTLGNNLNSAFPFLRDRVTAHYHAQQANKGPILQTGDAEVCAGKVVVACSHQDRAAIRRITLTVWRLVAAVPPILASMAVTDLMFSLQIAGLCGIVVALITPALLHRHGPLRYSLLPRSLQPIDTSLQSLYSGERLSFMVLLLAAVAISICALQMITGNS
jgi:amino acid permease